MSQQALPEVSARATERWLTARRRQVLPIPYFHVVFTLPRPSIRSPIATPSSSTVSCSTPPPLLHFGRDPRHLGGDLGITAVLHTWGQTLTQHVHVHCVVTGGALARDGPLDSRPAQLPLRRPGWRRSSAAHFLPACTWPSPGALCIAPAAALPSPSPPWFAAGLAELRAQACGVYCKLRFAGPEHVSPISVAHPPGRALQRSPRRRSLARLCRRRRPRQGHGP